MIEEQRKNGDYHPEAAADSQRRKSAPAVQGQRVSACRPIVQPMGILINTRMVKDRGRAEKLERSQRPEMEGQDPVRRHAPARQRQHHVRDSAEADGAAFNEKLAEQKPVFSRDMRNDARRVARGEYPIYVPQIFAFASDLKGLPVKVVIPEGGRALCRDGFRRAEECAASERRPAVHPSFPSIGIRS